MSHRQALAVKISISPCWLPTQFSHTFTCWGRDPSLLPSPPTLGPHPHAPTRPRPLTFFRLLMVQHWETEVMLCR